jgi:DNA topoisomerase VI subunit A
MQTRLTLPAWAPSDIYYRDPDFFRSQKTVDNVVDRLAAYYGVHRHGLNIVASAKGMVAGRVTVVCRDGIAYAMDGPTRTGHLISAAWFRDLQGKLNAPCAAGSGPLMYDHLPEVTVADAVELVLVVEKDAVYQTLLDDARRPGHPAQRMVLVTVRGSAYSDAARDVADQQTHATIGPGVPGSGHSPAGRGHPSRTPCAAHRVSVRL